MRKQTKLVAVLSAAALLAIGASMTSFAATPHWDQEDGEWVYLDRNGDRVADEWKKSNGQWYYLDEDGYMAKDRRVEYGDNLYYVDENGVKVTNAWVSMDNDDYLDDDDVSTVWYFFDGKGKAYGFNSNNNGVIKKVPYGDGKSDYFIFNNEGVMLSGWQKWSKSGDNEKIYWLGDENEGWARTGWQYLNVEDEEIFEYEDDGDPYDSEQWFWFDNQGRAKTNGTEVIGGKTYIFNSNGFMQDLWTYNKATAPNAATWTNASGTSTDRDAAFYLEDNGGRDKNWVFAYPKTDYEDYDDDQYWFWLNSKGQPFRAIDSAMTGNLGDGSIGRAWRADDTIAPTDANFSGGGAAAKSIKNKTYLFNKNGVMLTGLYNLNDVRKGTAQNTMSNGLYYFTIDDSHSSAEGQMVTNKKMTIDVHGEDETYYFRKDGRAYVNVIISGSVYGGNGKLVTDYGDGSTYDRVPLSAITADPDGLWHDANDRFDGLYKKDYTNASEPLVSGDVEVLINGNGKIKQNGTVTDVNGNKVTVSNYVVQPDSE